MCKRSLTHADMYPIRWKTFVNGSCTVFCNKWLLKIMTLPITANNKSNTL